MFLSPHQGSATIVACLPFASDNLGVISLSDTGIGSCVSLFAIADLMAKQTPASLRTPAGFPLQKKVYPAPDSSSLPESANLDSQSAAMSIW